MLPLHDETLPHKPVMSISIPADQRESFYDALLTLRKHDATAFLSASALIVKTIIAAAEQRRAVSSRGPGRRHDS